MLDFFLSVKKLFQIKTVRNIYIAAMFRNAAGIILYAYLPVFFLQNFPNYRASFSTLNAVALSICGLIASILEGIIGDKYERKTFWTKPIINIV